MADYPSHRPIREIGQAAQNGRVVFTETFSRWLDTLTLQLNSNTKAIEPISEATQAVSVVFTSAAPDTLAPVSAMTTPCDDPAPVCVPATPTTNFDPV